MSASGREGLLVTRRYRDKAKVKLGPTRSSGRDALGRVPVRVSERVHFGVGCAADS
jgi:hypothetical protein